MKRIKYLIYYIRYKFEHEKTMSPVCFNEWLDNEYLL